MLFKWDNQREKKLPGKNDTCYKVQKIIYYFFFHFIFLSEVKLAAILAISIVNFRQAQIEGTINVNMSSQTILSKFPKLNIDQIKSDNFSSNLRPFFSIEDYELIQRISGKISDNINESRAKRKEKKELEEKFISL